MMQHAMTSTSENVGRNENDVWYVGSGASNHMTSHGEWFEDLQKPNASGYVQTGDNTTHQIEHVGNVSLRRGNGKELPMRNVLHVPNIAKNLVSVGQIVDQGMQVKFNKAGCFIEKHGRLIARGKREGRMFTLDVDMPRITSVMFSHGSNIISDVEMWHKRTGHINLQMLQIMLERNVISGLPKLKVCEMGRACEACQLGKQNRQPFRNEGYISKGLLDLVHSDVWGPTKNTSISGKRYYVTFTDDCSRRTWVYFMKETSEVFEWFQKFKSLVEKQTGRKIKCLQSDDGGKYLSKEFSEFLYREGIRRQFSCRFTPQQNGVVERKNQTITNATREMLNERNIPLYY